ncbi:hypothetical protein [Pseudoalteromonas aurantia]|uniref:hypothetical protein n=1 Tax=Pseudoalteromonas aurantia TaxID=43654 RepID=UPI00110C181E|nr:hypothetical protein [Pseudoalteromonas aurantia]
MAEYRKTRWPWSFNHYLGLAVEHVLPYRAVFHLALSSQSRRDVECEKEPLVIGNIVRSHRQHEMPSKSSQSMAHEYK